MGKDNPSLAHGEELLYPPFSIPQPGFLTEEHAAWWRAVVPPYEPRRFWLREGRGVFPTQYGQNLVLRNVVYRRATWGWACRVRLRCRCPAARRCLSNEFRPSRQRG